MSPINDCVNECGQFLEERETSEPYFFPHSCARSQSSLAVRSSMFPIRGKGFGPGGNILELFRQTK